MFTYRVHIHRHVVYTWGSLLCVHLPCSQTQTCSVHVGLSAVCSPTVFTDMQCTRGALCCVFAYRVHRHRHAVGTWGSLLYVRLPCSQTQTCSVHVGLSAVCSQTQTCSVHVGLSAVCSQTQTCSVHVGLSAVCSPTVFTDTDM